MHDNNDRPAANTRTLEIVVAGLLFALGALVMFDSVRLGARWADDGPQAGYFPFYIGLLISGVLSIAAFYPITDWLTG